MPVCSISLNRIPAAANPEFYIPVKTNKKDGTRDVFVRPDFVIIYVNSFELEFVGSSVDTIVLDAVFVGYGLPKLGTYRKRV